MRIRTSAFVGVVVLLGAAAVLHGAAVQRWSVFGPDAAQVERLHQFRVRLADWEAIELPTDMPASERSRATSLRYSSARQDRVMMTTLVSGIPGAVAAHTPDVCYVGSGYKIKTVPERQEVVLPDGRTAGMWVADFEKKTATKSELLRVRWAWTTDGTWAAPDYPRLTVKFARAPVLYKLYVVNGITEDQAGKPSDPDSAEFLATLLAQSAGCFGG